MKKILAFYVLFGGLFLYSMGHILKLGNALTLSHVGNIPAPTQEPITTLQSVFDLFLHNIHHPFSLLLLQIMVILIAAKLFGIVSQKIGQPAVIGEVIAGILLGPSLLGHFFPSVSHFLFPAASLSGLQFLSQIGLVLFMFIIGMDLDLEKLKNKTHQAVVVSHASIIFPYFLGMLLSYFIYDRFAPSTVPFLSFSLFMGIAMSITAFPVLARIIQERGLKKTELGTLAITCAAADDVNAWCLLACVIAIVKAGSIVSALFTIALSVVFVAVMLRVVRPLIHKVCASQLESDQPNKGIVTVSFFTLLASAYLAEIIGIHALFGAFLAGVIMPQSVRFKKALTEKVEDVSLLMFLPIFFAFSGLRTQIALLNDIHIWMITAGVIGVAILGKFGGTLAAARVTGQNWYHSLSLGVLMNTRGLVELVVLNIGYDLGVLSPQVFAMMVIMALITTFMTGPCLDFLNFLFKRRSAF